MYTVYTKLKRISITALLDSGVDKLFYFFCFNNKYSITQLIKDSKSYKTRVLPLLLDCNMSDKGISGYFPKENKVLSSCCDTYIADEEAILQNPAQILDSHTSLKDIVLCAENVFETTCETHQQPLSDNTMFPLGNSDSLDTNRDNASVVNTGMDTLKKTISLHVKSKSVRWMFDTSSWRPSEEEWTSALSSVQPEECARICRFAFRRDARASLVGRLLARLFVSRVLSLPWCGIYLRRDSRGKPIVLEGLTDAKVNFSISHAGSWCVLAGEAGYGNAVGVDVVEEKHRDAQHLLRIMKRNLSPSEQRLIEDCGSDASAVFFRLWALKESYLKATGEGIGGGPALCDLSFSLCDINLPITPGVVDVRTSLEVKGNSVHCGWHFEESRIDESHIVAVAVSGSEDSCRMKTDPPVFQKISWDEIQPYLQRITDNEHLLYLDYFNKPESPLYLQNKQN